MSVDIDEQVRLLGLALERFVDDIGVDEVMHRAESRSMVSVVADGGSRRRTNGSGRDGGPPSLSSRHTPTARPARVRRRMVGVAACIAILVGVVGIFLVVRAPVEAPSSPVPHTFRGPAWFEALDPLLPEGYDHVAIQQSHRSYVQFEAFNPASAKSLHITVTRTAMSPDPGGSMTLADAQDAPWTDPNVDHNISLPDGRQIGLFCTFRPMPDTEPECPDVNGDHTDPEMLRSFALALATDLKPEDLPPVSDELDHVSIDTIRAAIGDISTSPETFDVEAPHLGNSFVQHGEVTSPDFFVVRTVTGFYPPFASDTPRASASVGEYRLTWQPIGSDAVWWVSDSPANGLDVADSVLDRAGQPWGDVPTHMPDGYAIWNVTSSGSSGEIRPLAPDAVNDDQEISWGVDRGPAEFTDPVTIELDNGTTATLGTTSDVVQAITWPLDNGTWVIVNSLNDAVDRDGLILLANSFQPANTDRIAATRTAIAQRVRTMFQPFRSAIIDNTTVEILALGDGPVAICIAVDRCETGFGPVLSQTTTNPVLMFNFEKPDGSSDVYGLLTGTFDRLEPSDGISVTTENTPDGTWVHAHRPAHIEGGDVRVINPSPELNDLLGFNV